MSIKDQNNDPFEMKLLEILAKSDMKKKYQEHLISLFYKNKEMFESIHQKLLVFIFTSRISSQDKMKFYLQDKNSIKLSVVNIILLALKKTSRHLPLLEEYFLKSKLNHPTNFLFTKEDYEADSRKSNIIYAYDFSENKNIVRKEEMITHILSSHFLTYNETFNMIENIDSIKGEDTIKLKLYAKIISYYLKFKKGVIQSIFADVGYDSPRALLIKKICQLNIDADLLKYEILRIFSIYSTLGFERRAVYLHFMSCSESIQSDPIVKQELNTLVELQDEWNFRYLYHREEY